MPSDAFIDADNDNYNDNDNVSDDNNFGPAIVGKKKETACFV
jgi:hypothetical protein